MQACVHSASVSPIRIAAWLCAHMLSEIVPTKVWSDGAAPNVTAARTLARRSFMR